MWTIVALAGCGGSSSTEPTAGKPVDTSTLVGTWVGSLNGDGSANSYGYSTTVTELRSDSTMTITGSNPSYGPALNAVWTVSADVWNASGYDNTNTLIKLTARLSPTTLTGTWTASSGRTGVFTMSKLP